LERNQSALLKTGYKALKFIQAELIFLSQLSFRFNASLRRIEKVKKVVIAGKINILFMSSRMKSKFPIG